jgi:outer membrane protein assembly factor BamA
MRRPALLISLSILLLLSACNPYKYVPKGQYMLKKVTLQKEKGLPSVDYNLYLHQVPNSRFLGILDMNLFFYNLSGTDTTKWINRTLRKLGEEPIIYDEAKNERSRITMENLLINQGYYDAEVVKDVQFRKRNAYVTLRMKGNTPYTINQYDFDSNNDTISAWINRAMASTEIKPGMLLSSEKLDDERARLVKFLQGRGFYAMQKDYLYYSVDSALGTNKANVSLKLKSFESDTSASGLTGKNLSEYAYSGYRIRNVYFMLGVDMSSYNRRTAGVPSSAPVFNLTGYDTLSTQGYKTVYKGKPFISPNALIENCRIVPGDRFDGTKVDRTYSRLNTLQYMKYINIRFAEVPPDASGNRSLDCYIILSQNTKQGMGVDIEGTNTAGDFGVAGNIVYTHRNFFNGSELFQIKLHGAYEALSSNFQSDYTELGGEMNLTVPEFKIPFLTTAFKQTVDAATEYRMAYQLMSRPEFERTVASMGVRYNWSKSQWRQTIDLVDLSYVYMPRVDSTFKADYLTNTSYLKYSYEDHFILRSGYTFSYTSVPFGASSRTYYTWKGNIESAGNLLYAGYALAGAPKDNNGFYKIGNINFSQYIRGELEYAKSVTLSSRSRLAYRVGFGLAYPYGNSTILPFEKRFYSGGANSVRGWSVRTLGPGTYDNASNTIDFMNQSGDIKLDMSMEYRGTLFWKVEGALFADAGNIWTVRYYADQPGGQFQLGSFYKQLAGSIGAGIRLNFEYFLIRVDCGMKVYDPSAQLSSPWRITSIDNLDDFALHFAVGYPF